MSPRMSIRPSTGESGLRVLPDAFGKRLQQTADETLQSLQEIFKEAGYEEVECQAILGDLLSKVKSVFASELATEQQILEHAKQEVISKSQEYVSMCDQLGRVTTGHPNIKGTNYTEKLAEIDRLIASTSSEVMQRQKLLDVEIESINELIIGLGEENPDIKMFSGPEGTPELSDLRVSLLRDYKNGLEQRKWARLDQMSKISRECLQVIKELAIEATEVIDSDDRMISYHAQIYQSQQSNSWNFGFHKSDLEAILEYLNLLVQEKANRKHELAANGTEIARLWTLLRIPSSERESFQASFEMNLSSDTIQKSREELERLREVRTQSLGRVIGSMRTEILSYWDELGVESDEIKMDEFPSYFESIESLSDDAVSTSSPYGYFASFT